MLHVAGTLRDSCILPDVWTRDMFVPFAHPEYGTLLITGSPLRLDGRSLCPRNLTPYPGRDTTRVLRELVHLTDADIERLCDSGVLVSRDAAPAPTESRV